MVRVCARCGRQCGQRVNSVFCYSSFVLTSRRDRPCLVHTPRRAVHNMRIVCCLLLFADFDGYLNAFFSGRKIYLPSRSSSCSLSFVHRCGAK